MQFLPLPSQSLGSSHPYPTSHLAFPTLTQPVTWHFPPLPSQSLGISHPYPASHLAVPTLTQPVTWHFPPLPSQSLGSSHLYPASHVAVPTFTQLITWQVPPLPGQKWWSVFNLRPRLSNVQGGFTNALCWYLCGCKQGHFTSAGTFVDVSRPTLPMLAPLWM